MFVEIVHCTAQTGTGGLGIFMGPSHCRTLWVVAEHGSWAHAVQRQGGTPSHHGVTWNYTMMAQLHLQAAITVARATLMDPLRECPAFSAHKRLVC